MSFFILNIKAKKVKKIIKPNKIQKNKIQLSAEEKVKVNERSPCQFIKAQITIDIVRSQTKNGFINLFFFIIKNLKFILSECLQN